MNYVLVFLNSLRFSDFTCCFSDYSDILVTLKKKIKKKFSDQTWFKIASGPIYYLSFLKLVNYEIKIILKIFFNLYNENWR